MDTEQEQSPTARQPPQLIPDLVLEIQRRVGLPIFNGVTRQYNEYAKTQDALVFSDPSAFLWHVLKDTDRENQEFLADAPPLASPRETVRGLVFLPAAHDLLDRCYTTEARIEELRRRRHETIAAVRQHAWKGVGHSAPGIENLAFLLRPADDIANEFLRTEYSMIFADLICDTDTRASLVTLHVSAALLCDIPAEADKITFPALRNLVIHNVMDYDAAHPSVLRRLHCPQLQQFRIYSDSGIAEGAIGPTLDPRSDIEAEIREWDHPDQRDEHGIHRHLRIGGIDDYESYDMDSDDDEYAIMEKLSSPYYDGEYPSDTDDTGGNPINDLQEMDIQEHINEYPEFESQVAARRRRRFRDARRASTPKPARELYIAWHEEANRLYPTLTSFLVSGPPSFAGDKPLDPRAMGYRCYTNTLASQLRAAYPTMRSLVVYPNLNIWPFDPAKLDEEARHFITADLEQACIVGHSLDVEFLDEESSSTMDIQGDTLHRLPVQVREAGVDMYLGTTSRILQSKFHAAVALASSNVPGLFVSTDTIAANAVLLANLCRILAPSRIHTRRPEFSDAVGLLSHLLCEPLFDPTSPGHCFLRDYIRKGPCGRGHLGREWFAASLDDVIYDRLSRDPGPGTSSGSHLLDRYKCYDQEPLSAVYTRIKHALDLLRLIMVGRAAGVIFSARDPSDVAAAAYADPYLLQLVCPILLADSAARDLHWLALLHAGRLGYVSHFLLLSAPLMDDAVLHAMRDGLGVFGKERRYLSIISGKSSIDADDGHAAFVSPALAKVVQQRIVTLTNTAEPNRISAVIDLASCIYTGGHENAAYAAFKNTLIAKLPSGLV